MISRVWALVAACGLSQAACPGHRRPEQSVDDPEVPLRKLSLHVGSIKALSGALELEVWRKGERVRLRQLLLVQAPDRVRMDTLSPFDQPLSMMASDGETITIYSLDERRFQRGPATPKNLARLLPLALDGAEIVALLRGGASVVDHQRSNVSWDDERNAWRVDLEGGARTQKLFFEPAQLRLIGSDVYGADGKLAYTSRFGRYSDARAGSIPQRMRFEVPTDELSIDVKVTDFEVNGSIAPEAFRIEQPRGVPVESLGDG